MLKVSEQELYFLHLTFKQDRKSPLEVNGLTELKESLCNLVEQGTISRNYKLTRKQVLHNMPVSRLLTQAVLPNHDVNPFP